MYIAYVMYMQYISWLNTINPVFFSKDLYIDVEDGEITSNLSVLNCAAMYVT